MTKAIFLDIDGTLVSFRTHKIPESAKDAVKKARAAGIKVFIATGRPLPFLDNLDDLEYDGLVCTNGTYIITDKGEVIGKHPICKEDIKRLMEYTRNHNMPVIMASENKVFAYGLDSAYDSVKNVFTLLKIPMPKQASAEEAVDMDIMQIIGFFTTEEEKYVMDEILPNCKAYRWHPAFADCISKGRNKAKGIDSVCEYYGIPLSQTMAVGDGGNDIEMIRHAGIGVAMGNAADDVKAAADVVTTSVDEDGVAKAIGSILQ